MIRDKNIDKVAWGSFDHSLPSNSFRVSYGQPKFKLNEFVR